MAKTNLVNTGQISDPTDRASEQFQNLLKQLPAEATAIYLCAKEAFASFPEYLIFGMFVGLAILVWVRFRARVSATIWVMSLVGYALWIYTIGDGPLNWLIESTGSPVPPNLGTFLVLVYTTIVAIFAVKSPSGTTPSAN